MAVFCPFVQTLYFQVAVVCNDSIVALDCLACFSLIRWGLASLIAWVYAALKVSIERRSHLSLSPEQNLSHVPPKAQTFCKVEKRCSWDHARYHRVQVTVTPPSKLGVNRVLSHFRNYSNLLSQLWKF